jgi:O-antigen ligase
MFGFAVKFAPYFRKGAPSVSARFDYWEAALATALEHPFVGTGPGTFARAYAKVRPPEAEMAKLVHNDYLEQASDSGAFGFLTYCGFWWGSLAWLRRKAFAEPLGPRAAVWLGLFGWCLQSLSEFGLYIPALAWSAFTLIGWLWAQENE